MSYLKTRSLYVLFLFEANIFLKGYLDVQFMAHNAKFTFLDLSVFLKQVVHVIFSVRSCDAIAEAFTM